MGDIGRPQQIAVGVQGHDGQHLVRLLQDVEAVQAEDEREQHLPNIRPDLVRLPPDHFVK